MSSKKFNFERKYGYIYQIINKINGKSYIGQTINYNRRIQDHFCASIKNKILHKAIRKYGKENFSHKMLWSGYCNNEHLDNLEIFFIFYFNTNIIGNEKGYGYNMQPGGKSLGWVNFIHAQKLICLKKKD